MSDPILKKLSPEEAIALYEEEGKKTLTEMEGSANLWMKQLMQGLQNYITALQITTMEMYYFRALEYMIRNNNLTNEMLERIMNSITQVRTEAIRGNEDLIRAENRKSGKMD